MFEITETYLELIKSHNNSNKINEKKNLSDFIKTTLILVIFIRKVYRKKEYP
jgi:hypothetical protein